ncbi:hypothetical protein JOF56_009730 [Kibdelosporangium banguiense]|uniref:Uncharacterized protein n=1 Tax=Kibdelosporangium banguiense TaxID=1365924 RepID=A0ABS4TZK5_9PSEU|nr:hypothetical protein [Kibdelosporangium banguiense]MBP2329345.1 hypothetical protein [Kibdelosporangium banguiense]
MWTPLITFAAVVLLTLITAATGVTLTVTEHRRGQRAVTVLKLLLIATLGASGVIPFLVRLHQADLI